MGWIGHKGAVWQTKLSSDSSRALSGSADFTAKLWDTFSGNQLVSLPHEHIVRTVALGPDGTRALTGGQEKKIRLWDVGRAGESANNATTTNGKTTNGTTSEPSFLKAPNLATAHEGTVKSVIWGAVKLAVNAENLAVSTGDDGFVRWWDMRTLSQAASIKLPEAPTSMELSIATSTLTITHGKTVSFIPLGGPDEPRHQIVLPYAPSSASVNPVNGDQFVVGAVDGPWVRVYGLEEGEERLVHKGHHGPVHCVEYSPDGEMYASGSEDGTIRLWQTTPGKSYGLWQGTINGAS
ncbi:hypothetical protein FRC08_009965 [Ceratobasidium sp. 394]|nr:hypothetical protein FRC08_009965 [Ceratobasidium sp. 394]